MIKETIFLSLSIGIFTYLQRSFSNQNLLENDVNQKVYLNKEKINLKEEIQKENKPEKIGSIEIEIKKLMKMKTEEYYIKVTHEKISIKTEVIKDSETINEKIKFDCFDEKNEEIIFESNFIHFNYNSLFNQQSITWKKLNLQKLFL
jgi:uncharacterized protein YdgA (DUF945 family)